MDADQNVQDHLSEHEIAIDLDDHRPQLLVRCVDNSEYQFDIGTSDYNENDYDTRGWKVWASSKLQLQPGATLIQSQILGYHSWDFQTQVDTATWGDGPTTRRMVRPWAQEILIHPHLQEFLDQSNCYFTSAMVKERQKEDEKKRIEAGKKKRNSSVFLNRYLGALFGHMHNQKVVVCLETEDRLHPDGRRRVALALSHPAITSDYVPSKPDDVDQASGQVLETAKRGFQDDDDEESRSLRKKLRLQADLELARHEMEMGEKKMQHELEMGETKTREIKLRRQLLEMDEMARNYR